MSKKYRYVLILWILLFVVAFIILIYPKKLVEITPDGWKKWPQTGAIYTLIRYKEGILAGGVKGLWYSDGNEIFPLAENILPKGTMVRHLNYSHDRGLWVGHSMGLSILYHKKWKHLSVADGIPKPPIQSIAFGENTGWIAGESGIVKFNGLFPDKIMTKVMPTQYFDIHRISTIMLDDYGNLWAGSSEAPKGGLFIIRDKNITLWSIDKGLPHPQVTSIVEDREGRVWVGTGFYDRGGAAIFQHTEKGWHIGMRLSEKDLAGPKVRSIMQDNTGVYWIGSERHGMMIRSDNRIVTILHKEQGLPSEEVTKTLQMPDSSIWLATLRGLVHLNKRAVEKIRSMGMIK